MHIHHKFIVIDAETAQPTIYTGSNNLSNNSTHNNDENLLEITNCPELAQTYFAEFMRLYQHYRARALWNIAHLPRSGGKGAKSSKRKIAAKRGRSNSAPTFTLKTTRDEWVKDAYKANTPAFLERVTLA